MAVTTRPGAEAAAASEPTPPSPTQVRDSAWRWIRWAAIAVALFLGLQLLGTVWSALNGILAVTLYVIFGGVLSFLASPLVDLLERRTPLSRSLAAALVLLGGLGCVAGLGFLAAGPLVGQAQSLARQLPVFINQANGWVSGFREQLRGHGIEVGSGGLPGASTGDVSAALGGILLGSVKATVTAVVDLLITLVVAFWLLKDGAELRAGLVGMLPGRLRSEMDFGLDAVSVVVGGYVRAQLLLAAIVGLMGGIGCWIIGVPFPLVVGLTAAVFELIPLVGAIMGGLVAMALALTVGVSLMFEAFALFVLIHLIEGYGLSPRIQARFVRVHPLVALLALLAGADAGGFLGAMFAVPAASLGAVFLRAAVGDWRQQRPDLFSAGRRDRFLERRRRRLLGEFRLFRKDGGAGAEARPAAAPDPLPPATP